MCFERKTLLRQSKEYFTVITGLLESSNQSRINGDCKRALGQSFSQFWQIASAIASLLTVPLTVAFHPLENPYVYWVLTT
jgi:predicted PurR-regulated permease PerM